MRKLALIIFLTIGTNVYAQTNARVARSAAEFVPHGYVVVQQIKGDLNKDHDPDIVLIIKGTDRRKFVKDEYRGELDRNRRGILVALNVQHGYRLVLENRNCFSSENEDGGVYFAPELGVGINRGNLTIHYAHGRYGYWTYAFRYHNSGFELIGYDSSSNRGPVVQNTVSVNLSTERARFQDNVNPDDDDGKEKFKETWKKFTLSKPIRLSEVRDFDELDVPGLLGLVQ
ncbi:MAG: hypothetical protein EOO64_02225 [Massilia sp.]|nr:MAG: hypothetical protein EOO64_02225 [Massilia sp.]